MGHHTALRRAVETEITLRPTTRDQEDLGAWAAAVKELRRAVPDWTAEVLRLIRENESLRAQLAASKRKGRK